MNIFALDKDTKTCARYHCDKHVVKMIVETAQILRTVHYVTDIEKYQNIKDFVYKQTHVNHPAIVWASESRANYLWLCELGLELCKEYTRRFGKTHKSEVVLFILYKNMPDNGKYTMTSFPRILPLSCSGVEDTIIAYRNYYMHKAIQGIVSYTKTEIPTFLLDNSILQGDIKKYITVKP